MVLAAAIDSLSERLGKSREALGDTDRSVAQLTDASVRLLELIRASAQHSANDLPAALGEAESRLAALGERGEALGLMLSGAGEKSREVSEYVIAAQRNSTAALEGLAELQGKVARGSDAEAVRLAALREQLAMLARDSEQAAALTQGSLSSAIATLEQAARSAVSKQSIASCANGWALLWPRSRQPQRRLQVLAAKPPSNCASSSAR
jgi:predicted metal-dependent hydrolase